MLNLKLKMKQKLKNDRFASGYVLLLALVFFNFTTVGFQAQERVKGVVVDAEGMPLPSVSVVQKGTTRGTSTDFDGNYSIELIPGTKTLVFSYLGFKTLEIPVKGQTTINVNLVEDSESLSKKPLSNLND